MARLFSSLLFLNEIRKIVENIVPLASIAVENYAPEVDAIINTRCKNKKRIESVLDKMLDFCWDKTMLELFRKLCKYYYKIDPRATAAYIQAYREMWDTP